ncbi:MAG: 2-C-methyl-D-erythritol 4-phosphate cytidylyltransferase [Myxococcota bacterium]|nr:2-C-methyl-D-erythritol 4-phosphate cytidylyltransferase [Myxococcota bacterium]
MRDEPVAALVLAAGRGERLGSELPKAFVPVGGVTMLGRSIERLLCVEQIGRVQPVVPHDAPELTGVAADPRIAGPVVGGAERQESVAAGLAALPREVRWVVVHDAARCLVEPADVRRVIEAAAETGAAILARPASDTIKLVSDGAVTRTLDRAACWAAQTPQVFRRDLLAEAHDKAQADGFLGSDDAQLVERLGVEIRVALGGERNLKITWPADLALAEQWLRSAGEGVT